MRQRKHATRTANKKSAGPRFSGTKLIHTAPICRGTMQYANQLESQTEEVEKQLQDLQKKKHDAYLAAKFKANKLKKDSFDLIWKIERAKELLMR